MCSEIINRQAKTELAGKRHKKRGFNVNPLP